MEEACIKTYCEPFRNKRRQLWRKQFGEKREKNTEAGGESRDRRGEWGERKGKEQIAAFDCQAFIS
jgi:hypothetical protein